MLGRVKSFLKDKDTLTLWMNNLLVLYAFLIPISQTIKATVFTFIVILFILRGDVKKYLLEVWQNHVVRAFVYLFFAYVIGLLWSENLKEGLCWVKSMKYGLYLVVFYSFIDGRYINKVISAFILGMLVSELTSYSMLLGIMPWSLDIGGIHFYTTQSVGDPSPFLNHIHYGVLLAFVVMLLAQRVVYSDNSKVMKIFMSLFVLSATTNIFITGGRTGYITFLLLLFVLGISYLKRYFVGLVLVGILVFSVAYNFSPMFQSRVLKTEKSIEGLLKKEANFNSSIGVRVGIFHYASQIIKENPLFGVGSGDSMDEIKKITPEQWTHIHSQPHEHNQFLSTFVKLGIVGFLVFLNIYYQIFKYKQEDKELHFIMIISTLAIAFGILTTQFNLRVFLPLWVVMLAVSMTSKDRKTIKNIALNEKVQLSQIVGIGAVFSVASLVKQLF